MGTWPQLGTPAPDLSGAPNPQRADEHTWDGNPDGGFGVFISEYSIQMLELCVLVVPCRKPVLAAFKTFTGSPTSEAYCS